MTEIDPKLAGMIKAGEVASALLGTAINMMSQAQSISAIVMKAQAENRQFTPEEWKTIYAADDAEKARGKTLFDQAVKEGR